MNGYRQRGYWPQQQEQGFYNPLLKGPDWAQGIRGIMNMIAAMRQQEQEQERYKQQQMFAQQKFEETQAYREQQQQFQREELTGLREHQRLQRESMERQRKAQREYQKEMVGISKRRVAAEEAKPVITKETPANKRLRSQLDKLGTNVFNEVKDITNKVADVMRGQSYLRTYPLTPAILQILHGLGDQVTQFKSSLIDKQPTKEDLQTLKKFSNLYNKVRTARLQKFEMTDIARDIQMLRKQINPATGKRWSKDEAKEEAQNRQLSKWIFDYFGIKLQQ